MTEDGKPTFVGSPEEAELAARVFELMMVQGRAYGADAPIRRSLRELGTFFLERGLRTDIEEVERLLDDVLSKNSSVFRREEAAGTVYFATSRSGRAPAAHGSPGYRLPVATARHMAGGVVRPAVQPAPKPTIFKRDAFAVVESKPVIKPRELIRPPAIKEPRPARPVAPPAPPKRVPQVVTPQGVVINMAKSPAEILAKHRAFFSEVLRDALASDERFVSFGDDWLLAEHLVPLTKGELRQAREFLAASEMAETDEVLCSSVFGKGQDAPDYRTFRFSLNYHMAGEKKTFEYVGTAEQRLWWLTGVPAPRIVRASLKAAEIGQDLKYLEDEPPVVSQWDGRWVHTLTFYEWENGILPYSPPAKLLLPPPFLKDQKIAHLRFVAPQFDVSVTAELHYPAGNRGGWIEGLAEILAVFVSGAILTIARVPDQANTYSVRFEPEPVREMAVLLYDEKRQRFVFQALPLNYRVDDAFLLERNRFKGLKDVRRLDEANRRKGDPVIMFAFEKIGTKVTKDGKSVYRAHLEELLPIVNIEKPFSTTSLLRFFATHPHYQKDEAEEGYWFYVPERA